MYFETIYLKIKSDFLLIYVENIIYFLNLIKKNYQMVLLDNDSYLNNSSKLCQKIKNKGTIRFTIKRGFPTYSIS